MTVNRVPLGLLFRSWARVVFIAGLASSPLSQAQFDTPRTVPSDRDIAAPIFTPVPIFFPINPPPLDRPVSRLAPSTGQTIAPPGELGSYVTEPFYAVLSTRLIRHTLDDKKRQKLDAYRVTRDALLEELQTELTQVRDAAPATRRTTLTRLAQRQTPRLAELEVTAEQLRSEFATSENDWSALREWRLGQRQQRGDSPAEIGAVMRASAFYQAGLAPAQRLLLREIAIEVTSGADDAVAATARQPYLFFSPALSRVILPDDVPAEIAAKVAAFETKKSTLKKELFDVISAQDGATFAFSRTAAVKSLAERQAPALAQLKSLADEIRDGLVQFPGLSPKPPQSPLTPVLTEQTMAIVQARSALQKATREKIDAITAEVPPDYPVAFATTIDSQGVKVRLVPRVGAGRGRPSPNDPLLAKITTRINEVGEEHRQRQEEFNRVIEELRGDVGRVLGQNATPKQIDEALDGVIRYNAQRENTEGYRDYRVAVFEPGLSPEQRRILLGGALRKLDLPLAGGERQPTRRPASW
jgi:hypothetical protein